MFKEPIEAEYTCDTVLPEFARGNPLAEGLRLLPTGADLVKALWRPPKGDFSTSNQSRDQALMQVSTLRDMRVPSRHAERVAQRLNSMMINGYCRRNPFDPGWQRQIAQVSTMGFPAMVQRCATSEMLVLSADSGMGKTSLFEGLFSLFPRSIHHRSYGKTILNQAQIPVLTVVAPINGSISGLVISIGVALDDALGLSGPASYTNQWRRSRIGIDALLSLMAQALMSHAVGLIHIDDFQRIGERSSSITVQAAATIIGLANVVGAPLVLSGTPAMHKVLRSSFEAARRATSRGIIRIEPAKTHKDIFHSKLMEKLFQHQLQEHKTFLTDELGDGILNLTAGNVGTEVALYIATQEESIRSGQPMTLDLFHKTLLQEFTDLVPELGRANRRRLGGQTFADDNEERQS